MIRTNKYFIFPQLISVVLLLSMASCAPVISKHVREQVRPDISFKEVLNNPEAYQGHMILLGGTIIETENIKEGTLLEVLQHPLGFRDRPKDMDESEGRFLALDNRYLDVNIYAKGRSITIAGEIQGKKTLPLGKTAYTYPMIHIQEMYLWPIPGDYAPYRFYDNRDWYYRGRGRSRWEGFWGK